MAGALEMICAISGVLDETVYKVPSNLETRSSQCLLIL